VLVTQDTEIEALLGCLTDEIRQSLNGSLVGLYVYGSLVTGDFDKDRSDIDLLAVLDAGLDGETFDRLDRMHARIVEDHPAWEDRIEVAYVPVSALWNIRTHTGQIAVISPGESFHLKTAGKDWLINWYTVREGGVTLCGPPSQTLIPEISQPEFVEAARKQAGAWKEWVYRMNTPGAQSYAVLTLCRVLYTYTHRGQASKRQAALWAQEYLPQWVPLIQWSLDWLSEDHDEETDDEAGLQETVRFVHNIADRINSTGENAPGARGDRVYPRFRARIAAPSNILQEVHA
jgi:predicted nucleotidyltransferase